MLFTVEATIIAGLPGTPSASSKASNNPADVVPVDLDHVPAEGAPFRRERIGVEILGNRPRSGKFVVVEDGREVVELVERGGHRGRPDLAFVDLAVAEDAVDAGVALVDLRRHRHAAGDAQALAQRAGVGLDARRAVDFRMALQDRAEDLQRPQRFHGDAAQFGQRRVLGQHAVPLAQQEPIAIGPLQIARLEAHFVEIEHGNDVGNRAGAAQMAGRAVADHRYDVPAQRLRNALQSADFLVSDGHNHYQCGGRSTKPSDHFRRTSADCQGLPGQQLSCTIRNDPISDH